MRKPTEAAETLQFKVDYYIDFQSDTYLPTFDLSGHILPKGETLLSPDTPVGRVLSKPCGKLAYACGDPFEHLCTYSMGWADISMRRIVCDGMNPAITVPPGEYQFVASVCYTNTAGTEVCSSKSMPIVFE